MLFCFLSSLEEVWMTIRIVDAIGLASRYISQLCAIFSCFIFSKLAYSVGSTCSHELPDLFNRVDEAGPPGDNRNVNQSIAWLRNNDYIAAEDVGESQLHLLKAIVEWYARMIRTTLYPFGTWFAVHWILYTIAAFMSISYLTETIILELYGKQSADKECQYEVKVPLSCKLQLAYRFFFAVEHCILFLYPCFRAASVTKAYSSMIKRVSETTWTNISLDDKEKFINYLQIQDCTLILRYQFCVLNYLLVFILHTFLCL